MSILKATKLSKTFTYNKRISFWKREKQFVHALKDFDIEIENPTIYGILGPNGAGKTTFIKHCLGLVEKTSGKIQVLGYNPHERKVNFLRQIGFISGQKKNLSEDLSGYDGLRLSGFLYGMRENDIENRIDEFVNLLNLKNKMHSPTRQLSLGQRMKFEIISSILHYPKLVFMDEPTIGLDFESQKTIRTILQKAHQEDGISIVLTSHYLPDITELCKKITVIESGQDAFTGTIRELRNKSKQPGYLSSLMEELEKQEN
jgi:ABC-2 type transport system ATP-binding protein